MKRVFRIVHDQAHGNAIHAVNYLEVRPEKPFIVTIETEKKKRTLDQNALYWKTLRNASLSSGIEVETLHEIAKKKFLGFKEIEFAGQIFEIPNSTAKLKTKEFSAYYEQVSAWLTTEGLMQVW